MAPVCAPGYVKANMHDVYLDSPPQVHGTWPAVAAALAEQPEQLCMSWQGLGSLLEAPRQRAAWRTAGALEAAAAEE